MKYRTLGRTNIKVSEVGLGAWQIGGPLRGYFDRVGWISHGWGDVDDEESVRLIHACGELGVNFIDTAAGYGAGHSEEVVGRAVKACRDKWIIETKGGESFTRDGINVKDFSKQRLLTQIDESLHRLDTDYVDVYLLHGPSMDDIEQGGCLEAIAEIKQTGKARAVGVSLGPVQMGLDLIDRGLVDVYQVSLSLLDANVADELLPAAEQAGVGVVVRCAFVSGFLSGRINEKTEFAENDRRSWQTEEGKRSMAEAADAFRFLEVPGRTLAQACLKYPLSFSGVSTIIPGSKSLAHMQENAATSETPELTAEERERIATTRNALG